MVSPLRWAVAISAAAAPAAGRPAQQAAPTSSGTVACRGRLAPPLTLRTVSTQPVTIRSARAFQTRGAVFLVGEIRTDAPGTGEQWTSRLVALKLERNRVVKVDQVEQVAAWDLHPAIAADEGGVVHVAWTSGSGAGSSISLRYASFDGDRWTSPQSLATLVGREFAQGASLDVRARAGVVRLMIGDNGSRVIRVFRRTGKEWTVTSAIPPGFIAESRLGPAPWDRIAVAVSSGDTTVADMNSVFELVLSTDHLDGVRPRRRLYFGGQHGATLLHVLSYGTGAAVVYKKAGDAAWAGTRLLPNGFGRRPG